MALIFVTGNKHKFKEINEIAKKFGLHIEMRDIPCNELQHDRIEEISRFAVEEACAALEKACFVEDAGLFIKALRGFPGPYSNFVYRTLGNEGLLKLMEGERDRRAEFRSAIGYCEPGMKPRVFLGKVKGSIALEVRGKFGFGFDPVFVAENTDKTFGEMEISEKNMISHRARAMQKFLKWYIQR
ncbi:MAG: non-canonical purine NTP pyrophosphatase [Hadesarchaea archaeon YNP_N21]|jgi:XTP/dITP diphosphohydrolase|nr:MAG: non-canonical purine NTP pyrophosphatase [Hadesarchaea archaeon YNP_N21]